MKQFLQTHVYAILAVALVMIIGVSTCAWQLIPKEAIILSDLPGPQDNISERSKKEIKTLLGPNDTVVGAWVSKISYNKTENPIVWYGAGTRSFTEMTLDYIHRQEAGLNLSSKELSNVGAAALRNTQASKVGDISCAPISLTALPRIAPKSVEIAGVVCRAPIPPFNPTANLAIVALLDAKSVDDKKVEAVRKKILQLQIDIYNRDFLAREIWIHE